jgi:hypothetical protein
MEYIAKLYELVRQDLLDEKKREVHFEIIRTIFESYDYE